MICNSKINVANILNSPNSLYSLDHLTSPQSWINLSTSSKSVSKQYSIAGKSHTTKCADAQYCPKFKTSQLILYNVNFILLSFPEIFCGLIHCWQLTLPLLQSEKWNYTWEQTQQPSQYPCNKNLLISYIAISLLFLFPFSQSESFICGLDSTTPFCLFQESYIIIFLTSLPLWQHLSMVESFGS